MRPGDAIYNFCGIVEDLIYPGCLLLYYPLSNLLQFSDEKNDTWCIMCPVENAVISLLT